MSQDALPSTLHLDFDGPVAILRLSRPQKRNALDDETILGMQRFFTSLPESVRAVVLHGAVVGGGLELASAAHIRIAEASTYYGLPEGQRGIFLGGGGTVRLSRLIGVPAVQDLMLTGRTLSAEEGQVRGISQYLVGNGEGLAKALELAKRAATNAPVSNFAILHALPRIAESDPASGFFTESLMASVAEHTPEARQRLRDFLEKRAAKVVHPKQ